MLEIEKIRVLVGLLQTQDISVEIKKLTIEKIEELVKKL